MRSVLLRAWMATVQLLRRLPGWIAAGLRRTATFVAACARSPRLRRLARPLRRLLRGAVLGGLAAVLAVGALRLGFQRVPPGHVGVQQVNSGSSSGIEPRDHPPGMHFGPRFLNRWHLVDTRVQALRFGWATEGGELPPLELRTGEGISVSLSAVVPYRILPGRAHRIVAEGLKESYALRVRSTCEAVLSAELARLSATEWSLPEVREEARRAALDALRERLADEHVEPLDLLLHGVYFPGPYEQKLQEKQLATQSRRTAEALARREEQLRARKRAELALEEERAALVDAATRRLDALRLEREAAIEAVEQETLAFVLRTRAEGEARHTELVAQGDRALAEAAALGEALRAEVLESAEGRRYQATQAARALRFSSITLDPGDPRLPFVLDLEAMSAVLDPGE